MITRHEYLSAPHYTPGEILTANIVRGMATAKNQKQAAVYYAAGVLMGAYARPPLLDIDWQAINHVALSRWTISGLERVKAMGWRAAAIYAGLGR